MFWGDALRGKSRSARRMRAGFDQAQLIAAVQMRNDREGKLFSFHHHRRFLRSTKVRATYSSQDVRVGG